MTFRFYPLRFEFVAKEPLVFPPEQASNILRGALGVIFRRMACVPDCPGARQCAVRASCAYARIFEPMAIGEGPSGLGDWPRPFVFRARHLDGVTIAPGGRFHFDLNLFSLEYKALDYFVRAFEALAREGLGARRARAELQRGPEAETGVRPTCIDLRVRPEVIERIRVEFLTPTELKHEQQIAARPEFPILFARIRDRIATLSRLYGAGELDIDFKGTSERAAKIRMTECQIRWLETKRRSSKTGQVHSIGGFIGSAVYEGDLGEFVPYLEAAEWTGVGRQAVWGKGEILISFTA